MSVVVTWLESRPAAFLLQFHPQELHLLTRSAEVGRLASFRTAQMVEFRHSVQRSGGIYAHRWGDALLRRLSIEFFSVLAEPLSRNFTKAYQHPGCHRCTPATIKRFPGCVKLESERLTHTAAPN